MILLFLVSLLTWIAENDNFILEDADIFTIVDTSPDPAIGDSLFYFKDMDRLFDKHGGDHLHLMIATCPLSHADSIHDVMPELVGYQHVVIFAASGTGEIISGSKAALPCPPHCGGGKLRQSFNEYMASH